MLLAKGYVGFVVTDVSDVRTVAGLLDEVIGEYSLQPCRQAVNAVLTGSTAACLPFVSQELLVDLEGRMRTGQATMFVSAPLRSPSGAILGILSFRIRPQDEFLRLVTLGDIARTEESFLMDLVRWLDPASPRQSAPR
jgi:eukaryotic-like serine/threonine-protein kinase